MKIDDIKLICEVEYSELLFDISSPPEHQCSSIDKIIKSVKDCESWASSIERTDDIGECHSLAHDIEWEVSSFYDSLETLRKNIEALRSWGEEWKSVAKKISELHPESLYNVIEDSLFLKLDKYLVENENNNS